MSTPGTAYPSSVMFLSHGRRHCDSREITIGTTAFIQWRYHAPSKIWHHLLSENMRQYAILLYPAANRVYADSALRLMRREIEVFNDAALDGKLNSFIETEIGGVEYLTFSGEELTEADVDLLSNASALYALFSIEQGLLRPIPLRRKDVFGSDLLTIQKYSGKTNEKFTKLLFNITALAAENPRTLLHDRLRILDPLCGRGTTLNQALMYGFDGYGIEANKRDFDEYAKFIKTWLRNNRLKHTADTSTIRRNKRQLGRRLDITLGVTKQRYIDGDVIQLGYRGADTINAAELFPGEWFDLLVTDAPYGVQHGSRDGDSLARNPLTLLERALGGWHAVLRPGGALGISWNTRVAARTDLARLLADAGFEVQDSVAHRDFVHHVDQAITRDLIVARKPHQPTSRRQT